MHLIGVDIGGSHISAAKVELMDREVGVWDFVESDVDAFGSADEIIKTWSELILKAAGDSKDFKIGIAMPGPYDYPNGISLIKDQGKLVSLYRLSVKDLLAKRLGILPENISFMNDAEAFLSGESYAGAGRDFQNSIGITLGTGLGSAIKIFDVVKDGKLWTAPFRTGIAEDYLGTGWFIRFAKEQFGKEISGVKDLLKEDFEIEIANSIFEEFGKTLGEFLFPYLIRLQSEGVVLGGKVSLAADRFMIFTQDYLERQGYDVPIKVSPLGEKSALVGAVLPFLDKKME
ncbi:MAG: ROK family protein [Algoriphagus sp.]|nr:ROK family protein [Algoriphagus sp.]